LISESVLKIDADNSSGIYSAINTLESSSGDSPKEILLKLSNTKGDTLTSIGIVSKIHNSNVDLFVEAEGIISPAGTILAAAGKPNGRKASFTTIFQITKDGKSLGKAKFIKDNENKMILDMLSNLTKKRSKIQNLMRLSGSITAKEAQALGIIDIVDNYFDKYQSIKEESKKSKSGRGRKQIVQESTLTPEDSKLVQQQVEANIDTSNEE